MVVSRADVYNLNALFGMHKVEPLSRGKPLNASDIDAYKNTTSTKHA